MAKGNRVRKDAGVQKETDRVPDAGANLKTKVNRQAFKAGEWDVADST
jgi:hypothetical protein